MKITIKDKEIELKNTMRAYLLYEEVTNKPFAPTSLMDIVTYFYAVVMANCKELELTFDEFIDLLDEQPQLAGEFRQWIEAENKKMNQLINKKKESKKK